MLVVPAWGSSPIVIRMAEARFACLGFVNLFEVICKSAAFSITGCLYGKFPGSGLGTSESQVGQGFNESPVQGECC